MSEWLILAPIVAMASCRMGRHSPTSAWIIRAGARVLLFTQDKMMNNNYCFHPPPPMIYSTMHCISTLGHCLMGVDIVETLINHRNSVYFILEVKWDFLIREIHVTCMKFIFSICLLIICALSTKYVAFSTCFFLSLVFTSLIYYTDTDSLVSQRRWKRLCQVTDTCPDFVNGTILMTNDPCRQL